MSRARYRATFTISDPSPRIHQSDCDETPDRQNRTSGFVSNGVAGIHASESALTQDAISPAALISQPYRLSDLARSIADRFCGDAPGTAAIGGAGNASISGS